MGLLLVRIAAGVTTGTLAILSAQPTDVVKIRMQADVRAPGEAARYRGVIHAYKDIAVKEGMAGLYKGELALPRTSRDGRRFRPRPLQPHSLSNSQCSETVNETSYLNCRPSATAITIVKS